MCLHLVPYNVLACVHACMLCSSFFCMDLLHKEKHNPVQARGLIQRTRATRMMCNLKGKIMKTLRYAICHGRERKHQARYSLVVSISIQGHSRSALLPAQRIAQHCDGLHGRLKWLVLQCSTAEVQAGMRIRAMPCGVLSRPYGVLPRP